jgi:hypothetical protein
MNSEKLKKCAKVSWRFSSSGGEKLPAEKFQESSHLQKMSCARGLLQFEHFICRIAQPENRAGHPTENMRELNLHKALERSPARQDTQTHS